MKLQVLPYLTVEVDDRARHRLRGAGERLRVNLRAYLLSAADDVDAAGDRVRGLCDRAVHRVDSVVASVNDRIAPEPHAEPKLRVVDSDEGAGERARARREAV